MRKIFILFFLLSEVVLFSTPIRVLYPNGGETVFFQRDTEIIRWEADKSVGDVVILLYRSGIKLFEIKKVVKNNPNTRIQQFEWHYSPNFKDGKGYRIRIRSLKNLALNDFSDMDFTIKHK
jgi:hypothetical protein